MSPLLNNGVIRAIFNESGKLLLISDWLIISDKGILTKLLIDFKILTENLLMLEDLFLRDLIIIIEMSMRVIGRKIGRILLIYMI